VSYNREIQIKKNGVPVLKCFFICLTSQNYLKKDNKFLLDFLVNTKEVLAVGTAMFNVLKGIREGIEGNAVVSIW